MNGVVVWASVACVLFAQACGWIGGQSCTDEADAALSVRVVDATTGDQLCGVSVTARDGAFEERLQDVGALCAYAGAWERAGTYSLTVAKDGYVTQTISGIRVDSDECHVQGRVVDVKLVPQ